MTHTPDPLEYYIIDPIIYLELIPTGSNFSPNHSVNILCLHILGDFGFFGGCISNIRFKKIKD